MIELSKCCGAEVRKSHSLSEPDEFGTWCYICTKCKEPCDELTVQERKLGELVEQAVEIIQWMSGSPDFSPEGTAYKGWLKVQPKIEALRAKLKEKNDLSLQS